MSEKALLLKRYNAARITLGVIIGFIIYNELMMVINPNVSTLFVVVVPQIAAAYAHYYFSGFNAALIVILFVIFPLLLNIICLILSKQEHRWLGYAATMMLIDAFGLVAFIYLYGFNVTMLLDVFVEICLIYYLLKGYFAGKKLGDNLDVEEMVEEEDKIITISAYSYDEQMAVENKTKKGGMIFVAMLCFFAALVVIVFAVALIATYIDLSAEAFAALLFGLMTILLIVFTRYVLKLSPYTSAKAIQYFILDGEICRCYNGDGRTAQKLKGLKVVDKRTSEFICEFITEKGNTKRIVIPNCYKGLEDVLKK